MENSPFSNSSPESDPSKSSTESDNTPDSKKKKKVRKLPFGSASSEQSGDAGKQSAEKREEKSPENTAEALWKKMLAQMSGEQPDKPESAEKKEPKSDGPQERVTEAPDVETATEQSGEAAGAEQLDELDHAEQRTVVEDYIASRQAELTEEQARAIESDDETEVAARAADLALLNSMQEFVARENEEPVEIPLHHAYEATAHRFMTEIPAAEEEAETAKESAAASTPLTSRSPIVDRLAAAATVAGPSAEYAAAYPGRSRAAVETVAEPEDVYHNRTGSALLVGGVLGYMLGRRHGRIKTEKQMRAVEKKLEKNIEKVQARVAKKEQQIRTLAREAYTQKRTILPERAPIAPTLLDPKEKLGLVSLKAAEKLAEAPAAKTRTETYRPAAETSRPKAANMQNRLPEALKGKKVAELSRSELLEAGAVIAVGATNLRRVYETNLISEQGMRRLVAEYERGGDVRAVLREELIQKEMSYERDPRMRNRAAMGSLAASTVVSGSGGMATELSDQPQSIKPIVVEKATADTLKPKPSELSAKQPAQVGAYAAVGVLITVIGVLLYILFTSK